MRAPGLCWIRSVRDQLCAGSALLQDQLVLIMVCSGLRSVLDQVSAVSGLCWIRSVAGSALFWISSVLDQVCAGSALFWIISVLDQVYAGSALFWIRSCAGSGLFWIRSVLDQGPVLTLFCGILPPVHGLLTPRHLAISSRV
ncbi:hypothetical protein KUCAC02_005512 [Chaenocephalus aceratus]|uniref:Uncharacterized protein n=1 Tax=Chaenocephalus aceratus TaxID=36190 RepID=A0ACB9WNV1_CHAAC|nr:hypothetical protein KUCAC02_005512 [Chaenocephalus aceratus]